MRYQGFIWAGLFVADMEAAVAFYGDVLGLPLVERDEACALFDAGGGALLELWAKGVAADSPKTPERQSVLIALRVEDLNGAVAELAAKGVRFLGEPDEYAGTRWIHFTDPEGNRLELKEVP